jgi:hypothetical protein
LAKHLTKNDVEAILNIIHGHQNDKLTWDGICEASEAVVGKKPTRQSLHGNKVIREAYTAKKESLKIKGLSKPKPSSLNAAADRIAKLQSELDCLKMKNDALLQQFVIWQYNSYKYGIKEHQLNEPLPRIDRERTD